MGLVSSSCIQYQLRTFPRPTDSSWIFKETKQAIFSHLIAQIQIQLDLLMVNPSLVKNRWRVFPLCHLQFCHLGIGPAIVERVKTELGKCVKILSTCYVLS
jgi:hypothetical protein